MNEDLMTDDLENISGEAVKEAEAAGSFSLEVPDDASVKKSGRYWTEVATILNLTRGVAAGRKSGNKFNTFQVEVEFGPEGSGLNVGRKMRDTIRLSPVAFTTEGKEQFPREAKMNGMSIRLFRQLFAALDIDASTEDGGISADILRQTFTQDGSTPCAGEKVVVELQEKPRDDGKGMNYNFASFVKYE